MSKISAELNLTRSGEYDVCVIEIFHLINICGSSKGSRQLKYLPLFFIGVSGHEAKYHQAGKAAG